MRRLLYSFRSLRCTLFSTIYNTLLFSVRFAAFILTILYLRAFELLNRLGGTRDNSRMANPVCSFVRIFHIKFAERPTT